jgi:hypothetical protein
MTACSAHTLFTSCVTHVQCPADVCQVQQYLRLVVDGKLPVNHDIVYELQVRSEVHKWALSSCICLLSMLSMSSAIKTRQRERVAVMADQLALSILCRTPSTCCPT